MFPPDSLGSHSTTPLTPTGASSCPSRPEGHQLGAPPSMGLGFHVTHPDPLTHPTGQGLRPRAAPMLVASGKPRLSPPDLLLVHPRVPSLPLGVG